MTALEAELLAAVKVNLMEALSWADEGQKGDPNGANSYQAKKYIALALSYLIDALKELAKP